MSKKCYAGVILSFHTSSVYVMRDVKLNKNYKYVKHRFTHRLKCNNFQFRRNAEFKFKKYVIKNNF